MKLSINWIHWVGLWVDNNRNCWIEIQHQFFLFSPKYKSLIHWFHLVRFYFTSYFLIIIWWWWWWWVHLMPFFKFQINSINTTCTCIICSILSCQIEMVFSQETIAIAISHLFSFWFDSFILIIMLKIKCVIGNLRYQMFCSSY